ncbi:MAG: ATP-binding protein [Salegentibacter sp.]
MPNSKRSITFKVIAGYVLIAALAGISVWFIYTQVVAFSNLSQQNNNNNEKLFLVSEITSSLYESENISRRVIQTGDEEDLSSYRAQIDSIRQSVMHLKTIYQDSLMQRELDSINKLLSRKTDNLEELATLREKDRNTSYYTRVINELRKVDESFGDYDQRFPNLEPYQRRVLVKYLEYAKKDNAKQLTNQTADSLINAVKNVLSELEIANQQFRRTVSEKENDLLGNDVILNQQLRKLLAQIEKEERQQSFSRAEASQQMLEDTSQIMFLAGSVSVAIILLFLILIVRDVTRSQRYRTQLEEAKNFAEGLLKSREQFTAAITHDLRSPLSTVIGYTDLMQKTTLDPKQKHYLQQMRKSSDFILHLVNDLLDLSKLEAGKMLIEKLPFNPKKLIEDTVYNSIPGNSEKNVEIVVETSEDVDTEVLSDPFRIKQIIANLVTNAYKFTEDGEIKVKVLLKKEIEDSYTLLFSVKDTGIGISKEKQEDIFEEFSQENSSIEKKYGGTGLGLSITKRLTDLLKGEISLNSSPGEGSEFIVCLPVTRLSKQESVAKKPEEKPAETPDLKGKKALVVDDEASQRTLTQELVKSLGMQCESAENGKEAFEKLNSGEYDLVLTDIQMPKMDGFGLISKIRKSPKFATLPVIALSGRTNVNAEDYSKAGFTKSLIKPYKPAELLQKISEIFKLQLKQEQKQELNRKKNSANYDLEEIFLFSGGDQEAMQVIIKAFLESSKNNLQDMESAMEENDREEMGRIAHKMLPMLKQMKATHLVPELEKLEAHEEVPEAEINKTIAEIRKLMQELEEELTV